MESDDTSIKKEGCHKRNYISYAYLGIYTSSVGA